MLLKPSIPSAISSLALALALRTGTLEQWKIDNGYHARSLPVSAMYRYKTLTSGTLSFRSYTAQIGEALANVKVLNKVIGLGIPERKATA